MNVKMLVASQPVMSVAGDQLLERCPNLLQSVLSHAPTLSFSLILSLYLSFISLPIAFSLSYPVLTPFLIFLFLSLVAPSLVLFPCPFADYIFICPSQTRASCPCRDRLKVTS